MNEALVVRDICKNYADIHALAGLSFSVQKGSMFGLIGADGAGKTTLMRVLTTLIDPDSGYAEVGGYPIDSQMRTIRSIIGYMPQKFSLYEDLSVGENMHFFADIFGVYGTERASRISRLLTFSRLSSFVDRKAKNLSGGMKQKLALSCALIHTPQILILDEPTTGVDPVSRKEFWTILSELKRDGITIVVSTPYMDEAEYCDELALLHKGVVLLSGTPTFLRQQYPYKIFKAECAERSLTLSKSVELPHGIERAYPVGGCIHIGVSPHVADPELLIRKIVPLDAHIEPLEPSIEDLFFALVSEGEMVG